jgi:hypothetical protein
LYASGVTSIRDDARGLPDDSMAVERSVADAEAPAGPFDSVLRRRHGW